MTVFELGKIQMVVNDKQGYQKGSTCLNVEANE